MSAHPRRVSSRALAFFAIAFAVFATSLAAASPASAHYELLNTDPAADSVVTALPDRLSLTFSGTLLADPGATVVEVVDASGASLAEGAPTVDGAVVSQALTGEADGPITVRWKVVYDDGHTGSDQFGFTVEAPAPTPTPTPTATPTPTTPPAPTPTESAGPSVAPEPPVSAFDATPWLIGGGILLVAVAGAVTYLLVSRAKRERALEGGDRSGSQPPRGR